MSILDLGPSLVDSKDNVASSAPGTSTLKKGIGKDDRYEFLSRSSSSDCHQTRPGRLQREESSSVISASFSSSASLSSAGGGLNTPFPIDEDLYGYEFGSADATTITADSTNNHNNDGHNGNGGSLSKAT